MVTLPDLSWSCPWLQSRDVWEDNVTAEGKSLFVQCVRDKTSSQAEKDDCGMHKEKATHKEEGDIMSSVSMMIQMHKQERQGEEKNPIV